MVANLNQWVKKRQWFFICFIRTKDISVLKISTYNFHLGRGFNRTEKPNVWLKHLIGSIESSVSIFFNPNRNIKFTLIKVKVNDFVIAQKYNLFYSFLFFISSFLSISIYTPFLDYICKGELEKKLNWQQEKYSNIKICHLSHIYSRCFKLQ